MAMTYKVARSGNISPPGFCWWIVEGNVSRNQFTWQRHHILNCTYNNQTNTPLAPLFQPLCPVTSGSISQPFLKPPDIILDKCVWVKTAGPLKKHANVTFFQHLRSLLNPYCMTTSQPHFYAQELECKSNPSSKHEYRAPTSHLSLAKITVFSMDS